MRSASDLEMQAFIWWQNKRPISWGHEEHLKNPTVNTVGPFEKGLALAAAESFRARIECRKPVSILKLLASEAQ